MRYNDLLEVDFDHASPANLNLDLCVKLKLSKVDDERSRLP